MQAPSSFDAIVIGAGAAGLFCAGVAGQLGQKVLLIDHAEKVAEKVVAEKVSGRGKGVRLEWHFPKPQRSG